jgi:hypothetical protein
MKEQAAFPREIRIRSGRHKAKKEKKHFSLDKLHGSCVILGRIRFGGEQRETGNLSLRSKRKRKAEFLKGEIR